MLIYSEQIIITEYIRHGHFPFIDSGKLRISRIPYFKSNPPI